MGEGWGFEMPSIGWGRMVLRLSRVHKDNRLGVYPRCVAIHTLEAYTAVLWNRQSREVYQICEGEVLCKGFLNSSWIYARIKGIGYIESENDRRRHELYGFTLNKLIKKTRLGYITYGQDCQETCCCSLYMIICKYSQPVTIFLTINLTFLKRQLTGSFKCIFQSFLKRV